MQNCTSASVRAINAVSFRWFSSVARIDARHADGAVLPHTRCENSTGNTFAAANRCPASQAGTRVDLGASGTSGAIALIVLLK